MRRFVRSQSPFLTVALLVTALAGCIDGPDADPKEPEPLTMLSVYEYRYSGDDEVVSMTDHGWMARITNEHHRPVVFAVDPIGNDTQWAPATEAGWTPLTEATPDRLLPGESRLYLFRERITEDQTTGFDVRVVRLAWDEERDEATGSLANATIVEEGRFERKVHLINDMARVVPGHHVRTATVGVWLNGTSFYTNIADLNASAEFPAGYDRDGFGGDPLPVYVYNEETSEQPARSQDHCYFVTIGGYNALLKAQAEGSTNVRWLAPEEAYTRPGAEDHFLYGDTLIFMNTIVRHDGGTDATWEAPDPAGECFHPNRHAPVPLPIEDWPPIRSGPGHTKIS